MGSSEAVAWDSIAMRLIGFDQISTQLAMMAHKVGVGRFHEDEIVVDSDIVPDWEPFEPAKLDWAVAWMNRWSKYTWFRRYILEVTPIFRAAKWIVNVFRKVGIVR